VRSNIKKALRDFLSLKKDEHSREQEEVDLVHEYFRVNYPDAK